MFDKFAILILMSTACWEVMCSSPGKHQNHLIAKQATLTSAQISCIRTAVNNSIGSNDAACLDVVEKLSQLYTSTDVVGDISSEVSAFPTFCRASCGQAIINAWDSCNAYNDVKDVANLLIGMCASDRGSTCYSNFDNLFDLLDDGTSCYEDFAVSGSCSSSCSNTLSNGVQRYGCCVNVPIDYEDASEDINDDTNTLFDECGVTRPSRCTNNPLNPPRSASQNNSAASEKVSLAFTFILAILHMLIWHTLECERVMLHI